MADSRPSIERKNKFMRQENQKGNDIINNNTRFLLSSGTRFKPTFYSSTNDTYYQLCSTRQCWCQVKDKIALFKKEYPDVKIEVVGTYRHSWCRQYGNSDLALYLKERDMTISRFAREHGFKSYYVIRNYMRGVPETYKSARIYSRIRDIVYGKHMPTYLDKAPEIIALFRKALMNGTSNLLRASYATGIAYPALYYTFMGKRFLSRKNAEKLEKYLKNLSRGGKRRCIVRVKNSKMYDRVVNSQPSA